MRQRKRLKSRFVAFMLKSFVLSFAVLPSFCLLYQFINVELDNLKTSIGRYVLVLFICGHGCFLFHICWINVYSLFKLPLSSAIRSDQILDWRRVQISEGEYRVEYKNEMKTELDTELTPKPKPANSKYQSSCSCICSLI